MQLTLAQAEIAVDMHRFRVLCCGRRFGKTTLAIDQIKGRASIPNSRIVYVAPTIQQARDIAWVQLKNDCKDAAEKIWESPNMQIQLVNGSLIQLKGWEAIENLRGQAFDLIVLDEVAMYRNFWLQWQEVIRPTLTDTKGEALFISTPKGFNHFYDLYNLQEEDADFKSYHFSSYDNSHLPVEEIDKAKQELSADRFAQEYMADFRKTEGLVYKEFDRDKHVFNELPNDVVIKEKIAGADFGFTNPTAIPDIWIDTTDTWWQVDEYYETGRTDAEVAEYVSAKGYSAMYPDPEAPAAITEMRRRGVPVRDVIKGKDSIMNGIDTVHDRLRAGKYKVKRTCVHTIREFETYSFPDKKPDHAEAELPIDEFNHMMDAIRYPVMMRARRSASAHVHYAPSAMPRDNLSPTQKVVGGPVDYSDKPVQKFATTYIPKL